MALLVQKYGGTSLAGARRIKRIARKISGKRAEGYDLVVVASAMGHTTDRLIHLARSITPNPDERELASLLSTGEIVSCSLLAMALKALGVPAVSLTGGQAGIRTEHFYTGARIREINPSRILRELSEGKVVIVAGFQGVTEDMDVTTLGRGGSDVTAVALAARLKAERCEIYTDVEGVYTADPRIVPEARRIPEISYEEMLELAVQGAKVMHPRAVELGWIYNIPIVVASSFVEAPGTLIRGEAGMELVKKVRGIAHDLDVAKVTVLGVPDRPGIAAAIFEPLAEANINVDTIVQNVSIDGTTDLTFTVSRDDLRKALGVIEEVVPKIGARGHIHRSDLGKVSIVGAGMQSAPGYAATMFRTLAEEGINIELITTSEIRITCIVHESQVERAVRALHRAFALEREE